MTLSLPNGAGAGAPAFYVAGGIDERSNPLAAAESYNMEEDKWEMLPPMIQPHGHRCRGVFIESKFMVSGAGDFDRSAEVFDPTAGAWRRWENMLTFRGEVIRSCLVASSCGELFAFSEQMVIKYDGEKNLWAVVASLPQRVFRVMCATQWRDWIFVNGLDSVAFHQKGVSYLFHPSTGKWIEVKGGCGGMIRCAATVEI
jgi:hypothetical protein